MCGKQIGDSPQSYSRTLRSGHASRVSYIDEATQWGQGTMGNNTIKRNNMKDTMGENITNKWRSTPIVLGAWQVGTALTIPTLLTDHDDHHGCWNRPTLPATRLEATRTTA